MRWTIVLAILVISGAACGSVDPDSQASIEITTTSTTSLPATTLPQTTTMAGPATTTTALPEYDFFSFGDPISIDARKREMTLGVSKSEMVRRRKAWRAPKPYAERGVLAKYASQVSSASLGAVTDLGPAKGA